MKCDEVRAWKDEAYRQSLTDEQVETLAANPAGELSEGDLGMVSGGDDWPGADTSAASASNTSTSTALSRHIHSFSLLCDITVFSTDIHIVSLDHLLGIAACEKRICINQV